MKANPLLISLLMALGTLPLAAQTFTWNGGGGDDLFGNGDNWVGGSAPSVGSGVVLVFDGSTRPTPDNNYTDGDNFGEWRLAASAGDDFLITGNGFGLNSKIENDAGSGQLFTINTAGIYARNNIEINPVGGDIVIGAPIFLDDNRSLNVFDGGNGNTLTLNGILSQGNGNGGSGSLILNETSTVILNADGNTYGTTTINSGTTLRVGSGGATGSLGSGDITNNGSLIFNRTEALTVGNGITGSGSVAVETGTVTFNNRKFYTGNTTVNGGILDLTGGGGQDGTLRGAVTINDGGTLRLSTTDATGWGTGAQRISAITINEGGTLNVNTGSGSNQTFSNLALTLQGGTISGVSGSNFDFFSGSSSLTTLASATTSTVSMNARLRQANTTFTVADGAAAVDLLWSGQLNEEGTGRNFIKDGDGRMNLTGAATYSGTTTVNGGYLAVSNLMRNTSSITVNNGSTLELGAINMFVGGHGTAVANSRVITVNGSTLLMNGSMDSRIGNITLHDGSTWTSNRGLGGFDVLLANTSTGAATVTVSGTGASTMNGSGGIHLQGIQNFNVADTTDSADTDLNVTMRLDNPGSIGGAAGGILKQGDGTMRLANTGNSFGGDIIIDGGTLIGQGAITTNTTATTLGNATDSRTITVNDTGTLSLVGNNVFGGNSRVLANIPTVVVNAGGTMTINDYNVVGNITLNGGTLTASKGSNASYQTYEFAAGSTITVGGSTASTISTSGTNNAIHIAGNSTLTLDVADVTGNAATDLTLSAALINGSADRPGTGALLKTGVGTVTLSGGSTYTGGTTLSQGTIIASNANALGTGGTVTINDTNTGANNTTLLLGNVTMGRAITVANEGTGTVTLGANGSVANPEFSGPITLNKAVTLDGSTNTDRLTFTGGIGGTGDVTIAGTNRVVFNTAANTYTGSTTISAGSTLQLGVGGSTATQFIPNASVVNVGAGGVIQFAKGNNNETIGGLTGTGLVQGHPAVGSTATTLTIDTTGSHTFGGVLSNGGAGGSTLSLVKDGTGTQTLTGTNTYTGPTNVSSGTLRINGSLANTTTTVEDGATLEGLGSIAGTVNINNGGTLSPGNSIGSFTVGNLTMASGSTFKFEADNATATGADLLVAATLGLTGVNLDLTGADLAAALWNIGDKLTLISYTGTAISSGFTGFDDDTTYTYGSNEWLFQYADTTPGNNFNSEATGDHFITLTLIPEPTTALLGSLGLLTLLRRRR